MPGAWAGPAIRSVTVQPPVLVPGQPFSVTVQAVDVTQATATVDFRPGAARVLRLVLAHASLQKQ